MILEHFLNDPNRTKFENRENTGILVNSVKSGTLGHSERQNSAVFKISTLNFVHVFTGKCSFTCILFFENLIDFLETF